MEARALFEREYGGGDVIDGVLLDEAVAVDAVNGAAARVEQAHVVVNLSSRGNGGAGIAGGVFLLDGDGGGQAIDFVGVGLLNTLEELAGIGGQGFDVAALALSIDGVKGERAFAGAGDAADDGQLAVGNLTGEVLQVVGPRAADDDGVVQREGTGQYSADGNPERTARFRAQATILYYRALRKAEDGTTRRGSFEGRKLSPDWLKTL